MYVKHAIAVNSNAPRAAPNGKMGMSCKQNTTSV
jgi:hypothetical protein